MSENMLAILSLLFLIAAIVLGFLMKKNIGFIAIGFALILGKLAGYSDNTIIAGFSASLFVTLAGVTFLFAIAEENGTLELMAKKIVALSGHKTALIPVAMFVLGFIISAMGPGPIPAHALVAAFGVPLALQMGANPMFICAMGQLGAMAGCGSPLSPTAIIGENLAAEAQIAGITFPMFASTALCFFLYAAFIYLVVFRGFKLRGENPMKLRELPPFTREQKITMLGVVIMAVVVLIFGFNVGLVSFLVAVVLGFLKVGDEKACLKKMPWGTILMVCGVGILMGEVIDLGGIDIVVQGLTSIMTAATATPIFGVACGVLSWFSSTSGVVMPTMIPTIPDFAASIGVNEVEMVVACVIVANCAGLSPASTAGAQVLAYTSSLGNLDASQSNKLFIRLFALSAGGIVFMTILGVLGLFRIFC